MSSRRWYASASCTMAAAFPFTVSTTGRLLFLSCFMKSPERRRNVVSDWMSFVISSINLLLLKHLFRCCQHTLTLCSGKGLFGLSASIVRAAECSSCHSSEGKFRICRGSGAILLFAMRRVHVGHAAGCHPGRSKLGG